MRKTRIIVSVTNDLFTDNRVNRVCAFLNKHEFEVTLVGRKLKQSQPIHDRNYKIKRFRLWFNKGPLFYANYNLRLFFYLIFHKADVLVANDLDTLLANYYAKKWKRNCKLIYDSHEYFTEVPELVNRPKVQRYWKKIEQKCIPAVDHFYTVNDSIAALYREEYKRDVQVVRNISSLPEGISFQSRKELGLPENKKIVIFQGAGINIDRGAEELVQAFELLPQYLLLFVGSGDVIELLKHLVKEKGLETRVWFMGKKPYTELLSYTHAADLGVSLDKNTNLNYKFSLPNKLFDYIHCGTPVLVSDLPEIRKIVEHYSVGLIVQDHQPENIAKAIQRFFEDSELYARCKQNTQLASAQLTWEQECKVLEKIYL